jgi:hypothetical protein
LGRWRTPVALADVCNWYRRDLEAALTDVCLSQINGPGADFRRTTVDDPEQNLAQATMNDSSAPMSATGILWSTFRKQTKHPEAWVAEMDGRRPFIRLGLNGNVVPTADIRGAGASKNVAATARVRICASSEHVHAIDGNRSRPGMAQ